MHSFSGLFTVYQGMKNVSSSVKDLTVKNLIDCKKSIRLHYVQVAYSCFQFRPSLTFLK